MRAEISAARSIVEIYQGHPTAQMAAEQLIRHGYHGCWVLALGTNDAANVAVGSYTSMATRIRWMMSVTRGQPAMWVNVKSLLAGGPYPSLTHRACQVAVSGAGARARSDRASPGRGHECRRLRAHLVLNAAGRSGGAVSGARAAGASPRAKRP